MGVLIKTTNGKQFNIDINDFNITILDFKQMLVSQSGLQANEQRLVFKGKILKDESSLESYGITDGSVVHLVRFLPPVSPMAPAPSTPSNVPSQTNFSNNNSNPMNNNNNNNNSPFGSLFGNPGMGLGGGMGAGNLRNMMGQNPELMQQMLNSPLFQGILSDPDTFRAMMLANPQIRALIDSNPQFRQVLNDPQTIRQMMDAMRNPNIMQEMMRNQDLAMANIESMPGGYNALRRMYQEIQEPLNSVSMGSGSTTTTSTASFQPGNSTTPNNAPIPNPWGRSTTQSSTPSTGAGGLNQNSPMPNMFNLFGNSNMFAPPLSQTNPPSTTATNNNNNNNTTNNQQPPNLAGLFGSIPNAGNSFLPGSIPGMPPMNPALMAQMAQNPMFRDMMRNTLSNPEYLNQLSAMNPMFNDPRFREQIQDPQFIERMTNPDYLQAVMQLNDAMSRLQSFHSNTPGQTSQSAAFPGGFGSLFPPPMPSTTTSFFGSVPPPSTTNAGNASSTTTPSARPNPWANAGTGITPSATSAPSTGAPSIIASPQERFASQLKQLESMGFTDTEKNIEALTRTNGNVNAAVDYLLS